MPDHAVDVPGDVRPLLDKADVVKRLNISLRTVDRLIADGELPVTYIAERTVRFRPEAIEAYIDRQTRVAALHEARELYADEIAESVEAAPALPDEAKALLTSSDFPRRRR